MMSDLRSQAEGMGLRFLELIPDSALDPDLIAQVPVEWARSHCMLPLRIEGEVCVVTADIDQVQQQEDLALLIGEDLKPVAAPRDIILQGIERCYYSRDDSPDDFLRGLVHEGDPVRPLVQGGSDLLAEAEKAPVTRLINLILLEAVKRNASDIHFEPFESRLRVRYRVDGNLYEQSSPPKHLEDALVSRLKVMGRMDIAERRLPQDGMARVRVGEREIDVRVSTVPVAEGERVVLRLLDQQATLLPMERLGMSPAVLTGIRGLLAAPHGMIVVSGPTGAGKTTTLYAALGQLDSSRRNIMTIEDPIEYQLPDIGQIQVKPKIGLTFAQGLRHILRQDPDIVLVGETRDRETADIAVRASLTGHLVFTTLHTNDAPGTVSRLIDMGVEPYLLASSLRGALAQRLIRRLCPHCRREAVAPSSQLAELGDELAARAAGQPVWEPVGCERCLEGYSGRMGVFELVRVDMALREAIRRGSSGSDELRALAVTAGMRPMVADAVDRLLEGATSLGEVLNVAAA
ncbi:MAG: type II/IV secretion system protein [Lentisphaerae bacterium]|nr:type II/IV secretion system protein [Lentisphaerota bacterium]